MSTTDDWLEPDDRKIYEDHWSEFRSKLDKLHKASDLKAADYGIFFASAGHASLIDYPTANGLQKIAADVWESGGIVSAVCHGGTIFNGLMGKDGKPIIQGKRVTGFTTRGEEELREMVTIKSWNVPTIEASAEDLGATYVSPDGPRDSLTQIDGRLVTGEKPASAHATAEAVLEAFNEL